MTQNVGDWGLRFFAMCLTLGGAQIARAEAPKGADTDALFDVLGGSLEGQKGLGDDLTDATKGVGPANTKKTSQGLSTRSKAIAGDGTVKVDKVFVAPRMVIKKGKCEAKPKRVTYFEAPDFPFDAQRFSVCAQMHGGAGRAMRMHVSVLTGRGKLVGSAESIADFTGKTRLEHAVDFPPLVFPEPGVYRYIIEIEGERVANVPLFEVRPPLEEP